MTGLVDRCPWCHSKLEMVSPGGMSVDTWECPCCGARKSYGSERLPNPDSLRERSERLAQLANEVEDSEIAARMEVA